MFESCRSFLKTQTAHLPASGSAVAKWVCPLCGRDDATGGPRP